MKELLEYLAKGLVAHPDQVSVREVEEEGATVLELGARLHVEGREMTIVRRAGDDKRPLVRLEGIEDRPAAETLRGSELLAERVEAPELSADEWWAEEIEGCAVRDGPRQVGTVR